MFENKRILICPLNWGLGHATRDIPIIRDLIAKNNTVIIAADKQIISLFVDEFPALTYIHFPSFAVKYSEQNLIFNLFLSLPRIFKSIFKEHKKLKEIINDYKIDVVISDNRFGLWNKNIHSIFITHQIMIKLPKKIKFFEKALYRLNQWFINKYDECWIPDYEGTENLSGDLSHKFNLPKNTKFILPKSRFLLPENPPSEFDKILVMLSGPEPHRSILEKIIIDQHRNIDLPCLIVQGKPEEAKHTQQIASNLFSVSHLDTKSLTREILSSKYIICRSGYSSVMDLHALNRMAILIPTPGQTEQEYLGEYLHEKGLFINMKQNNFDIKNAINAINQKLMNNEK